MKKIIIALFVALITCSSTEARRAADRYKTSCISAGYLTQASVVCKGEIDRFIKSSIKIMHSGDLGEFSDSYPDISKKWMMDGVAAFNADVFNKGISAACKAARRLSDKSR